MKLFIKNLLRERLIQEKLSDVDDDVDMLYQLYFKKDIDTIQETGIITSDMFKKEEINTAYLKSDECREANKNNLCLIKINFGSNYYNPIDRRISVSINYNALNYVMGEGGNLNQAIESLHNPNQKNSLRQEFSEEKIKGSIHHELAHWIDDTLHNQHIKKRVNKASEMGIRDLGGVPINSTKMEIQGQIHNIKQLHNKYKNEWDNLTFNDLVKLSPTLNIINNELKGDIKNKWLRDLKTRMHREGLLGKNMS